MSDKDYVLKKILNTKVQTDPWKHMVVYDFLPESLYQGIVSEAKKYEETMNEKNAGRGYVVTINKSVDVWPDKEINPNLYQYYKILTDADVEFAIKKQVNVEDIHENKLSKDLWSSYDIQKSGFIYEVHPDREEKIHTLVHYLADPGDDITLGTTLYSSSIESNKLKTETDYLKRAKYFPNSAILFSPCEKKGLTTNHAMFHTSKQTEFRKTLQTFWLKEKRDWTINPLGEAVELKRPNLK
jgi:hypothetical protein